MAGMLNPVTPRPGRPRDPAKDDAALEATLALLAEVGFHRIRIDDVATRAGVPKSTIYRRWPSLNALIIDAYRVAFPESDLDADLAPLDALDALIDHTIAMVNENPLGESLPIAGATIMQEPELADEYRVSFVDPYWNGILSELERGEAEGVFTPQVPVEDVASMLFGQCAFLMMFRGTQADADAMKKSARVLLGVDG